MDSDTKGDHPQIGMNRIRRAAESVGTPAYVYDLDIIRERFGTLTRLFGRNFGVSFAAKSNPNIELLRALNPLVTTLDVSSCDDTASGLQRGGEVAILP